jgi:hypothetical protein
MKYGKMIVFAGLAGLAAGFYISVSMTFLVLLIGLLIVPPIVAIVSTIKEGVPIILKEYARYSQDKNIRKTLYGTTRAN